MQKQDRMIRILSVAILFSMLLSACAQPGPAAPAGSASSGQDLKGNISISGAFAMYPMMQRWGEEFSKLHPGVTFDISAGGAGKGMADTLSGAVDIGMVSRDILKEEEDKGAFWVAVVKDAVFPTINAQNPVLQDLRAQGIKKETFIGIFITGEIKTWGQVIGKPEVTDEIHVYTRSDSCGAADAWAKYLGNKKQEDLQGVGVFGDPGLMDAVVKDPLGIGFNNLGYAFDPASGQNIAGSALAPIDANANGKADADELIDNREQAVQRVVEGKYPSPPARALNVVTKGKPSGVVLAFIQWILTDGQKFISEAGYVNLPKEQIDGGIQKIK